MSKRALEKLLAKTAAICKVLRCDSLILSAIGDNFFANWRSFSVVSSLLPSMHSGTWNVLKSTCLLML